MSKCYNQRTRFGHFDEGQSYSLNTMSRYLDKYQNVMASDKKKISEHFNSQICMTGRSN